MNPRARSAILAVAVLIAFWMIWSKLRIVLWVQTSFWQVLLLFGVIALAIFLVLDHLINRSR